MTPQSAPGVEMQHNEAFYFSIEIGCIDDMAAPEICCSLRCVADLHSFWQGTFPQGNNAPLGRMPISWLRRVEPLEELWLIQNTPFAVRPRLNWGLCCVIILAETWTAFIPTRILL